LTQLTKYSEGSTGFGNFFRINDNHIQSRDDREGTNFLPIDDNSTDVFFKLDERDVNIIF